MKPKIRLMFYISKINGLAPFQIHSQRQNVKKTTGSFLYSLIFGSILQVISVMSAYSIFYSFVLGYRYVVLFVSVGEISFTLARSTVIYLMHMYYHNDIIRLINQSIVMKNILSELRPSEEFFDEILMRQHNARFVTLIVQVLSFVSATTIFDNDYSDDYLSQVMLFLIMYNNAYSSIVSGFFFYGGLMLCTRFFRMLNDCLELMFLSLRNRKIEGTGISLEGTTFHLEQFGILFTKFSSLTNELFKVFGLQILVSLISSAGLTLSSVRNSLS